MVFIAKGSLPSHRNRPCFKVHVTSTYLNQTTALTSMHRFVFIFLTNPQSEIYFFFDTVYPIPSALKETPHNIVLQAKQNFSLTYNLLINNIMFLHSRFVIKKTITKFKKVTTIFWY